ncbi:restriction endonuclease [Burkholderia lata]|nr:restriction endonuclease [Burkholderia lata]
MSEVPLDDLFSTPSPIDIPIVAPLVEALPYEQLPWQMFESLCAHLLKDSSELKVCQAIRYGREGQDQAGIDIIATSNDGVRVTVAECKRYRDFSKSQLSDWVKKFLAGKWVNRTQKYVLCVAVAINDTKITDTWIELFQQCQEVGIDAELWDSKEIDRRLRRLPGIVTQFFGRHYAEKFCSDTRGNDAYPSRFRTRYENLYESSLTLENESISISVNLPNAQFPHFGAIFNFARSDLSGISFSVSGDQLVQWLQWRFWAPADAKARPYAQASTWAPGKFVLATRSTRLTLTKEEVEHLDWIFERAWPHFLDAAFKLESSWRFFRFKRLEHSGAVFSIASLSRQDWAAILAFANEHDCSRGDSERHIFDQSQGMLKVYVENRRQGLNGGYHVMLRAFGDGGMTLPWEGSLDLGWEPLTDISSRPMNMGPSDAWDAEFTHDWMLDKLCPWVEEWVTSQRTQNRPVETRWFKWFRSLSGTHGSSQQPFKLDVTSNATLPRHGVGTARTLKELAAEITYYQMHFHQHDKVPVHPEMMEAVLILVRRHLKVVPDGGRGYIASKLHMDKQSLEASLDELLADRRKLVAWSGDLDLALRCLTEIFRKEFSLSPSERDYAIHMLKPLANRVKEDFICYAFSEK